jgi:predicted dehydrogenase
MRRLIGAGQIGRIVSIRSVFSSAAPLASSWRRSQDGGALLEQGSHHFDLVRYLTGQDITAIQNETRDDGVQAWSFATLAQGGRYQGFFSLDCADDERFEVYGEQGRLSLQRYASAEVEVHPRSGHRLRWRRLASLLRSPLHLGYVLNKFRSPYHEPSYLPCLKSFLQACRGSTRWAGATPGDGLASLRCALGRL